MRKSEQYFAQFISDLVKEVDYDIWKELDGPELDELTERAKILLSNNKLYYMLSDFGE